jgi:hypothetical protein
MAKGQLSSWLKLVLVGASAGLLIMAFGSGCNGFFQDPTLSTLAIQPPTPSVEVSSTYQLQAWGNFSDGTRQQLTSGVAWSSDTPSNVSIDPNTGIITGQPGSDGAGGTANITAASQGITAQATATSYVTVSNFEVCNSTSTGGATGCAADLIWAPANDATQNQTMYFVAQGVVNGATKPSDLTVSSTWTTPTGISCTTNPSPALCTLAQNTATGTYTITVTYGSGNSAAITVNATCTPSGSNTCSGT